MRIVKTIDIITVIFLVLGGLNWGLIGVSDLNVVDAIFGQGSIGPKIIYTVVGCSAIWQAVQWRQIPKRWK